MRLLIIIIFAFIFKSSLTFSEEVKMMECKLVKIKMYCSPTDATCDPSNYNKSYTDTNYYLTKYVKKDDKDEIFIRNEGKWKIFKGLDIKNDQDLISYKKDVSDYTGYYKFVLDRGTQVFEFWFDFFYPSRKWSHTIFSPRGDEPSTLTRHYKCREYKN